MNLIPALIGGILIGWLIEWGVDWFYWRRKNEELSGELADARAQSGDFEGDDGQYAAQVATLQTASQQLTDENSQLRDQVSGLQTEKADLLELVASLNADNAALQTRMATMVADLKDDLQEIYGVGPVIEGKLNAAGIYKFRELAALSPDRFREILGPDTERVVNEEKIISLANLAVRATDNVRGDDLQAIKGIGPVIAGLLNQAGVYTFADLARLNSDQLEVILGEHIENLSDEADIIQQARNLAGGDS
jgi:predicted flap endonuclease-1-like 5' DNA nuclease